MKILIRVDGGGKVGHGHLYRMMALGEELELQGASVQFVTRTPEILPRLPAGTWLDEGDDASQGDRLMARAKAFDSVVVDLPELPGSSPPEGQAIHVIPRSHPWPGLPAPKGWRCTILRREFRQRLADRDFESPRLKLFVSGGGCGAAGLDDLLDAVVDPFGEQVLRPTGSSSASQVVGMMDCASLGVIAYGMTALECAARGLPFVCLCPTVHHEHGAKELAAQGACVNLGLSRDRDEIFGVVRGLLQNRGQLWLMSQVGPRLVDGWGAVRVAKHILRGEQW